MSAALAAAALPLGQLVGDNRGEVSGTAQLFAVIGTVLFLGLVIELVRRRRLVERYALLWIAVALFGVVLAIWNDALNFIAESTGIASPTNALFLLGLVAVVGLLLNFSAAISRLSEETKILAQTISRLDAELRQLRGERPAANGDGEASGGGSDSGSLERKVAAGVTGSAGGSADLAAGGAASVGSAEPADSDTDEA